MEKQIVWTATARKDFWEIVDYLHASWPETVLDNFHQSLELKITLLKKQPQLGFKSKKYSRFRKTLVTKYYILIYAVKEEQIVIMRIKHGRERR